MRRRALSTLRTTVLMCILLALAAAWAPARAESSADIQESFSGLPEGYGPVPLWWWDGEQLDIERMQWQLDQLKAEGVTSTCVIYVKPNQGNPPYFSEKWWDIWTQVVEECKKRDMTIWFYDQIGFGDAGWMVKPLDDRPDLEGRHLGCRDKKVSADQRVKLSAPGHAEVVSAVAYRIVDGEIKAPLGPARRVGAQDPDKNTQRRTRLTGQVEDGALTWKPSEGTWRVYLVYARPNGRMSLIDEGTSKLLIDRLYNEYARRCGDALGDTIQGSFQDELWDSTFMPWSEEVAERFKEQKGYDIRPALPALWHDLGGITPKVRIDYHDVSVELAEKNFYKPIYRWHKKRELLLAHDQWGRRSATRQTAKYGDYYLTQRWFSGPGYDDSRVHETGNRNFRDAKLSASIADLYDRPRVWFEAFHTTGWGLTPAEMVAWTNENYAYGANIYDKHGLYYTTYGSWWEWAPPSAHFRQPYWEHYDSFADPVRRLSYLLTRGEHVSDVAVLYPAATLQAERRGASNFSSAAGRTNKDTWKLARHLFRRGMDLDYVDYQSLSGADARGKELNMGGSGYRALVLPSLTAVHRSTMEKALEFYRSGGTVISFGRLPGATALHGRGDKRLEDLTLELFGMVPGEADDRSEPVVNRSNEGGVAAFVPGDYGRAREIVNSAITRDFNPSEGGLYVHHRRAAELHIYFIFNVKDEVNSQDVFVRATGRVQRWNTRTGEVKPYHRYEPTKNGTRLKVTLQPHSAKVIVLRGDEPGPGVTEDNLADITSVAGGQNPAVTGTARTGGTKRAVLRSGGQKTSLTGTAEEPPSPVTLDGPWKVKPVPTMNNRWGDFQRPVREEMIGPQAREFLYWEEPDGGSTPDWQKPNLDESGWRQTRFSFGPYFRKLGPVPADVDEEQLQQKLLSRGNAMQNGKVSVNGRNFSWRRYYFSKRWGLKEHPGRGYGLFKNVPDEFIDLGKNEPGTSFYLWTAIRAPRDMRKMLRVGTNGKRTAWLNDKKVLSSQGGQAAVEVQLKEGVNPLLLRLVQTGGGRLRAYSVLSGGQPLQFSEAARWIWTKKEIGNRGTAYFRRSFTLDGKPQEARLRITCDNGYQVHVNGTAIGGESGSSTRIWSTVEQIDVTDHLHAGRNVIAVKGIHMGTAAGLLAELHVESSSGENMTIATNEDWPCSETASRGWKQVSFDDSDWKKPVEIAPLGGGPWGNTRLKLRTTDQITRLAMRWFRGDQEIEYDIHPGRTDHVGWYRFTAPPGLERIEMDVRGEILSAWVSGREAEVVKTENAQQGAAVYHVRPEEAEEGAATVALRIRHRPGTYGGAAVPRPIRFECGEGTAPAGHWSEIGLRSYSGILVYRRSIKLDEEYTARPLVLDLGDVAATAQVRVNGRRAGQIIAPPWEVQIGDLVRDGENTIEIRVANTLANHYETYTPTPYVFEGQTESGLLGPVRIRPLSNVRLRPAGTSD